MEKEVLLPLFLFFFFYFFFIFFLFYDLLVIDVTLSSLIPMLASGRASPRAVGSYLIHLLVSGTILVDEGLAVLIPVVPLGGRPRRRVVGGVRPSGTPYHQQRDTSGGPRTEWHPPEGDHEDACSSEELPRHAPCEDDHAWASGSQGAASLNPVPQQK